MTNLVADAQTSIQTTGAYILPQSELGARVAKFIENGYPILTPHGFEFLAQNSLDVHVSQATLSDDYR